MPSFDTSILIAATLALSAGIISLILVYFNERKRRRRREFRRLISEQLPEAPRQGELKLARALVGSMHAKQLLSEIDHTEGTILLEEYIVDLQFQENLKDFILKEREINKVIVTRSAQQFVMDSIDKWPVSSFDLERNIVGALQQAAVGDSKARALTAQLFIKSRKGYFQKKIDLFIRDVKQVVMDTMSVAQ